jgi:hypothetical protein
MVGTKKLPSPNSFPGLDEPERRSGRRLGPQLRTAPSAGSAGTFGSANACRTRLAQGSCYRDTHGEIRRSRFFIIAPIRSLTLVDIKFRCSAVEDAAAPARVLPSTRL